MFNLPKDDIKQKNILRCWFGPQKKKKKNICCFKFKLFPFNKRKSTSLITD